MIADSPPGRSPRRTRPDDRRTGRRHRSAAARAALQRPRSARGAAGIGQNAGLPFAGGGAGGRVQTHSVHARPSAQRHRRNAHLRSARKCLRHRARTDLRQRRARRRDQSRAGEGAVGAAGSDAGAPSYHRAAVVRAARSVRRDGNDESARLRRHLRAADRADGPLPDEDQRGLSVARRRAAHSRSLRGRRHAAAALGGDARRRARLARPSARGTH